jgi:hypothetical protein
MTNILIIGALVVVVGLFVLLSAVPFLRLGDNRAKDADSRH